MFFRNNKWYFVLVNFCFFTVCRSERDYFDSSTVTLESEADYVDPHSFYYDKHTQKEVVSSYHHEKDQYIEGDDDRDGGSCGSCDVELRRCKISLQNKPLSTDIPDEILSRRFVNMLLSRTKFRQDGKLFTGHVELEATTFELEALRNFGVGKLTLREVDTVLNNVMKTPEYDRIYESAMWVSHSVLWMYSSTSHSLRFMINYKEMVVGIIATLYLMWILRKMRFNMWIILSFSIVTIFVISFFITWWKLVQEAEIKHTTFQMKHMEMPIHCQPSKMSSWDKIANWFSSTDDCEKYYEAMMKTPFLQVTPAQALSHMFSHVLYEPISLSGKTLAAFLKHVTDDMSPLMRAIVQFTMIIAFLPGLVCCIILMAGGSLGLGGFGPFSLLTLRGPSQSQSRRNRRLDSKIERTPIEVIRNDSVNGQHADTAMIENGRRRRSNRLSLKDSPADKKKPNNKKKSKNGLQSNDKNGGTSKAVLNEATPISAGGDFKLTNETLDSEVESARTKVKEDVRQGSKEVGSGDRAL